MDESHFVSKNLYANKVWGEIGQKVIILTNTSLDVHYFLTLMTTLSEPNQTTVAELWESSNSQWDFGICITYCIYNGYLSKKVWFLSIFFNFFECY